MGQRRRRCNGRRVGQCYRIPAGPVSTTEVDPQTAHLRRMHSLISCVFYRVKTKLQVQVKQDKDAASSEGVDHYESTADAIVKIAEKEGVVGLYSGIAGSLLGVASTNFAYFYWYSVVRSLYMASNRTPKPPGTAIELTLGAVAGAVAQIFTIPVSVITTRQQTQPKNDKKGLIETGREVVDSEDGWSGLWRGLKASLILVVNPAITYGAYQRLKDIFFPTKNNLKPWEAFCECHRLLATGIYSLTEQLQSSELCQRHWQPLRLNL